ncbi:MAG: amidase domain-containing protein [Candidatus Fimenecus sp.]
MRTETYNRAGAVAYAKKWALSRNPRYFNFDGLGGDCTNFASQCLFAGSGVMHYKKDVGWYYNSPTDRAAAWSGVKYLHKFLTTNRGVGPFGEETDLHAITIGDLLFLQSGQDLYHTLVVTGFQNGIPLICCHTADSYMRPLSTYYYEDIQPVHIQGVRVW